MQFGEKYKKAVELTPAAEQVLAGYPWPGNVRQLRNFCERLAVIAGTNRLEADFIIRQLEGVYMIRWDDIAPRMQPELPSTEGALAPTEKEQIVEALNQAGGNRQKAAELLGISKSSLWRRMKKYQIGERF